MVRRKQGGSREPLGLFERSAEVWRAMGAPPLLWDDAEAVRVARLVFRPGYRLDTLEGPRSQLERVLIRRIRRDVAGVVLRAAGRLTEREAYRLDRWPPFRAPARAPARAPRTWRAGVTVADVIEGRLPDGTG